MNPTEDTLALIKSAQLQSSDLLKSFVQPGSATTGLQAYNLEAPSKKLFPVLTPLRNRIPRKTGGFATQANWKAITGINSTNVRAGVSEGRRGGSISHSLQEYFAAFRGLGIENSATFEADYAATGFEDVKALAATQTLQALMIQEELVQLGGNGTVALGTTPTPTLVAATGGSLPAGNQSVICVALGVQAYWDVAGLNNGGAGQSLNIPTAQVPGLITRTNADGTIDTFGGGSARQSSAAALVVALNDKITAALATPVKGAYAYAWYWGAPGAEVLGAVTTVSKVVITAAATGTQTAASLGVLDNSTSALEFDGILTQIAKTGSGAYYSDNGASPLTSDGSGGIEQIEDAFLSFWNLYRISPQTIYVSAKDLVSITQLVISGGGSPTMQVFVDVNKTTQVRAGIKIGTYLNKVTGSDLDLVVHPNMPPGTIMFWSDSVPSYLDGVSTLTRMLMRQEYYQIEWPLRTRKYEYGVYLDGVLQCYFPPAFGVITNVVS